MTKLDYYTFRKAAKYLTENLDAEYDEDDVYDLIVHTLIEEERLVCGFKRRNVGQIVGPDVPEFMFLPGSDVEDIHDGKNVSTLLGYETAEDVMQANDDQLWGSGSEYILYKKLRIPLSELRRFVSKVLKDRNPTNRDVELQHDANNLAAQWKDKGKQNFTKRNIADALSFTDQWKEMTNVRIEKIIRKKW